MSAINKKPELQDRVRHKEANISGTVIAKYNGGFSKILPILDVLDTEDKVHYGIPAYNWEVIKEEPDVK